jgi:acetyltransferase-like isoleucine patch superfamily enzyme
MAESPVKGSTGQAPARRLPPRTLSASLVRRWRRLLGRPAIDRYDIGDDLVMGRHSYGKPRVRWYFGDSASVRIGSFCSLADDVLLMVGGKHPTGWVSTFPFRARFELPGAYEDGLPATDGDIVIGSDVYIGRGARIMSGVRIGDGAVVGACSVVAKDIRPYAIVAGNPAREFVAVSAMTRSPAC